MEITSSATIEAPIEKVWAVLVDIPRVTTCLPGAEITEVIDANTYKANVTLKVGPIGVSYRAVITRESLDEATRSAVLRVEATDSKGRGNASATVTTSARAEGAATVIDVVADAKITGVIAQFGQGVVKDVAGRIMSKFAANVALEVDGAAATSTAS